MTELIISLFKPIVQKIINRYIGHRFGKDIYIDRVKITKSKEVVLFDIITSSTSDQDISLCQLTVLFLDKHQGGINGAQEVSNQYQTRNSDDFSVQKTNNAVIVKFNLLEKQNSKSTNRFIYEWTTSEKINQYSRIESFITYSVRGELKQSNKNIQENPLLGKHTITGS